MNIKFALIGIAVFVSVDAYANDPMSKLQDMLNDLGGTVSLISVNNGRTIKCAQGGTKKIAARLGERSSSYFAYYDYCKENNTIRDAIYEIDTYGDKVIRYNEKPNYNRVLFNAAVSDNIANVRMQLKNRANVNSAYAMPMGSGGEIDRWTPLMSAALNGNLEIAKLLVKQGAWINYLNSDVKNALWYATSTGNAEMVKFLLGNGAYVNNSDLSGTTPLMTAAINGDLEIVKLLLRNKTNIDSKHKDGDSALMFAIANGNSKIAKVLIDAGADLNISNKYGITALIICAVENNIEIAQYLIKNKAALDAKTDFGKTAVEIAAAKGHTELVRLLSRTK